MHADDRHRLHALRPVDVFQMDHRVPLVRVALAARLHARLAADAAVGVDEELEMLVRLHCCASSLADIIRRASALRTRQPQTLYSGNLADRILRGDGQLVGAFLAGPVIGNEDRVGADRGDDHRLKCDGAAARFGGRPVVVFDAELLREARVDLDARLGILIDQRADAARLRAGEELADDAAGGEEDRVLFARRHRPAVR